MPFDGTGLTEDAILKVLLRVQREMNEENWVKKIYQIGSPTFFKGCLVGWIQKASDYDGISVHVEKQLIKQIGDRSCNGIEEWNDRPGRRFASVRKLVDETIEARQKELLTVK